MNVGRVRRCCCRRSWSTSCTSVAESTALGSAMFAGHACSSWRHALQTCTAELQQYTAGASNTTSKGCMSSKILSDWSPKHFQRLSVWDRRPRSDLTRTQSSKRGPRRPSGGYRAESRSASRPGNASARPPGRPSRLSMTGWASRWESQNDTQCYSMGTFCTWTDC